MKHDEIAQPTGAGRPRERDTGAGIAGDARRSEQVRRVAATFDQASGAIDETPVRFFDMNAEALVAAAQIAAGETVLDVATGTGKAALAAARRVGPSGRVVGIDISRAMLARARQKTGDAPIEMLAMDGEALGFADQCFDVVLCAFGLFYFPDMRRGLREMRRVLRPGGRVAFSAWTRECFEPLYTIYQARLVAHGVSGDPPPGEVWLYEPENVRALLEDAGFGQVRVLHQPTGYMLRGVSDWWTIASGSALRGQLDQLSDDARDALVREVTADLEALRANRGLYLDASATIGIGIR